jgi:hypothetical protein
MSTPDDAPFVTAIENDADLKQLLGGPSGKSEESYRKFLSASKDLRFLIVESLAIGFAAENSDFRCSAIRAGSGTASQTQSLTQSDTQSFTAAHMML